MSYYDESENTNGASIWIIVLLILFIIFGKSGKYDGLTAEDWFDEYDYAEARLEELQYEFEDLQSEFENLEDDNQDLKDCIEGVYYYNEDVSYCL